MHASKQASQRVSKQASKEKAQWKQRKQRKHASIARKAKQAKQAREANEARQPRQTKQASTQAPRGPNRQKENGTKSRAVPHARAHRSGEGTANRSERPDLQPNTYLFISSSRPQQARYNRWCTQAGKSDACQVRRVHEHRHRISARTGTHQPVTRDACQYVHKVDAERAQASPSASYPLTFPLLPPPLSYFHPSPPTLLTQPGCTRSAPAASHWKSASTRGCSRRFNCVPVIRKINHYSAARRV